MVNSTKDASTPVKFASELSNGITNSRLILVEEDHLFIRNKPDLLLKPVREFLEEIENNEG
ncbi:hypothetical protein [Methanobacterium formicicum]|uniref:hypothetical protein n=1 Tax=Methanobacterium formicicum TaxID=2162 RepID=UPI001ED9A493|nr:hypothetical protein [Methanobacterium formicicum]